MEYFVMHINMCIMHIKVGNVFVLELLDVSRLM